MCANALPQGTSSRRCHLHVRAEAFASAIYYGECSIGRIAPNGAALAEKKVRIFQSKWWLPGNDPNHPSLCCHGLRHKPAESNLNGGQCPNTASTPDEANEESNERTYHHERRSELLQTSDPLNEDYNIRVGDERAVPTEEIDAPMPVFARDDDLNFSFGSVDCQSSSTKFPSRNVSYDIPMRTTSVVTSAASSLMPPWLTGSSGGVSNNGSFGSNEFQPRCTQSGEIIEGSLGTMDEKLSAFTLSANELTITSRNLEPSSKPSNTDLPHVTSESEADDFGCSIASCDDSSAFVLKCLGLSESINCPQYSQLQKDNLRPDMTNLVPRRSKTTKRRAIISFNNEYTSHHHILRARDFSYLLDQYHRESQIKAAKSGLLSCLELNDDNTDSPSFLKFLTALEKNYICKSASPSSTTNAFAAKRRKFNRGINVASNNPALPFQNTENASINGIWLMISSPSYPSCLGKNDQGSKLFTLGRMSFDMYQPLNLVCSIQKQYNTLTSVKRKEDIPLHLSRRLRKEVENGNGKCSGGLKTYNIIASITIEPCYSFSCEKGLIYNENCTKKPLRGILTNYGYATSDPSHKNRKSIWFTGGSLEPADDDIGSMKEWKELFGTLSHEAILGSNTDQLEEKAKRKRLCTEKNCRDNRNFNEAEKARHLASRILLGAVPEPMEEDGTISFYLRRPIGGHGLAYCDVVYMDNEIRVMRGHSGSIYVFKKVELDGS